jgi:hypothetical protein
MDTSIFLAQLLGPVLLTVSVAMLARPKAMSDMMKTFTTAQGQVWVFLLGLLAMIAGLSIVLVHNVWDGTWRVILTLFGWGLVIKGAIRLFFPEWALKTAGAVASNKALMKVCTFLLFVIGLYLSYRGFM